MEGTFKKVLLSDIFIKVTKFLSKKKKNYSFLLRLKIIKL